MSRHTSPKGTKPWTTLTLPADALQQVERIACDGDVNLSSVVAEVMTAGLSVPAAAERSEQVLRSYRQAFAGFSAEEILLLDGVVATQRRKR